MAHLLGVEQISKSYPNRPLLSDLSLGLNEGDRIGVVGRNGDGKSTLLSIIGKLIEPDDGRVTWRRDLRVGILHQRDNLDDTATVGSSIVGDQPEHEWASDPKIRAVISGLVADLAWDASVSSLSGGQRRRVALAALLAGEWDVLLLDEPTNHLDVEGITWLAAHLNSRWTTNAGGLLVVTHDRWFLDEITNQTWEVHDGTVERFEGGFAAYILQRVERDRLAATAEEKRQNLMRKELAWLRRGAPARSSKPKFRIQAANELIADVPPVRDTVALSQLATARLGKDVVDILDASVSFGDKQVLDDVTWRIAPGERTGILGANGAGKSTLMKLISGELAPTSGRVKHGKTVRVATLSQQLDELREWENKRVSELVAELKTDYLIDGKELTPVQLLERLGFTRTGLYTPIRELSGGQRRRLQLLVVLLGEPNVLLLDEPTNDLDTDMLAAVEDLLDGWPGTLLVVSHDRYFLERVTDRQVAVLDGHFRDLPGGVDEYLQLQHASDVAARSATTTAGAQRVHAGSAGANSGGTGSEVADSNAAGSAALSGADRRQAEKESAAIERKLAKLEQQKYKLMADMAAHDQSDYAGLGELNNDLSALQDEIDEHEMRWLELGEQLG